MKKLIILFVSAVLMLSLFAGCGESAVFETSKNAGNCKLELKKDSYYDYSDFTFCYSDIKDAESVSKLGDPKGKWVKVELSVNGAAPSESDLDTLVKDENILLNGAAATSYNITVPAGTAVSIDPNTGQMKAPNKYVVVIYYDVPKDFRLDPSKVTCFDKVTRSSKNK